MTEENDGTTKLIILTLGLAMIGFFAYLIFQDKNTKKDSASCHPKFYQHEQHEPYYGFTGNSQEQEFKEFTLLKERISQIDNKFDKFLSTYQPQDNSNEFKLKNLSLVQQINDVDVNKRRQEIFGMK